MTDQKRHHPNLFNENNFTTNGLTPKFEATPYQVRIIAGMTQLSMARTMDISLRQWQYYEYGEKTPPVTHYMAMYYIALTHENPLCGRNVSLKARMRNRLSIFFQKYGEKPPAYPDRSQCQPATGFQENGLPPQPARKQRKKRRKKRKKANGAPLKKSHHDLL